MVQKPVWNSAMRVNHQNSIKITHPHSKRNVVPTAVLTRLQLVSLNTARPVTTAFSQSTVKCIRPVKNVFNKAYSPVRRPINQRTTSKNSHFNKKVTTVKVNVVQDIVYSDDEEDVGAKADLSNLETNIPVSPILTTRVYNDHDVNQIIDLPKDKRAIGLKWVFRNKKDEKGIVIRNKARVAAQGHTQEEGIDYDEVFVM
nr:retrovirus-related Pol polyprotein from transposon TNT 1-94 [Tanacetum cinerariifolium]